MLITGQRRISFPWILQQCERDCVRVFWMWKELASNTPVVYTNMLVQHSYKSRAKEKKHSWSRRGETREVKEADDRESVYTLSLAIKTTERKVDEQGVVVDVNPSGNFQNIRDYAENYYSGMISTKERLLNKWLLCIHC